MKLKIYKKTWSRNLSEATPSEDFNIWQSLGICGSGHKHALFYQISLSYKSGHIPFGTLIL